jgi:hypothetical protein
VDDESSRSSTLVLETIDVVGGRREAEIDDVRTKTARGVDHRCMCILARTDRGGGRIQRDYAICRYIFIQILTQNISAGP